MKTKSVFILLPLLSFIIAISSSCAGCSKKETAAIPPQDTTSNNPPPVDPVITQPTGIGNGVNLQPSYYNGGNVDFAWALMKQNDKIKTVRIEIEPSVDINLAKSWIQQAKDNGYEVIATYHKYTVLGSDNVNDLLDGANWWKENYTTLSSAGPFTVNLMNEWSDHNISSNAYADAYNNAIGIVRQVYSGPIVIDCPGWGQETTVATAAVKGTNGKKISDTNIILSVHIYPGAWNQAKNHFMQNADIDELAATGRKCMVGEFGNGSSGSADWSGLVVHAKSKGWAVLAWCWNGDGGTMNMVSPQWSVDATATTFTVSSYFAVVYAFL